LVPFRDDLLVNLTVMTLVVIGGLGFIVIRDIRRKLSDWRRPLLFHTRLMLVAVPILIVAGAAVYLMFDSTAAFSSLPTGRRFLAVLFQSVTTRTAGFNTVDQTALDPDAQFLTTILMFVGGGSGSTAGGIKVSTAAILFLILFRGVDERGDIRLLKRRLSSPDAVRAAMFFLKAVGLLFASVFLLSAVEQPSVEEYRFLDYFFESVSALGTVGLSLGLTPKLSAAGKLIIAATMFGGRVGLFSLIIRPIRDRTERLIDYPKGEVLIG
jgi:trk system potassium uptake protein TrkH